MITMQPPMIIEYPSKFVSDGSIQEKYHDWNETLNEGDYELEYFRPVLYSSYHAQNCTKEALVGNRERKV